QVRTFSDGTKDTNYFRKTEKNIVLIYYKGRDFIFIDFEKPINDSWNSYNDFYGYIKQRDLSLLVEAGKFGIGLVESIRFRNNFTLRNARVNGINYP
ncbi:MAG TPA: hypothetical protein VLN45_01480, partial [Ignavibacteriaceae bacterium]|nr:hypothetical protein [Ignavibacteriaceae bacterium]